MKRIAAIVDPFSSGRFLAPELKKAHGIEAVAVLSSKDLPSFYLNSFQPEDFIAVIEHEVLEDTLNALKAHSVSSVIAGSEPGVLLADALGSALGLTSNEPILSPARRDKFLMIEAVRAHGLKAAKQIAAKSASEAIQWIEKTLQYPVVVKPKDSAGTDGVTVCGNAAEITSYFEKHLNAKTMLGTTIDAILVQEYLRGTEYVVDTVSSCGKHQVVAVWRYGKKTANGSEFVYDTMSLLTELEAREQELVEYTCRCLDALGIVQGPAHSEVMLTPEGPSLVETGARIHGGNGTLISGDCIGYNQIDRTALLHSDSESFDKSILPYASEKAAVEVFLIANADGRFKSLVGLDSVQQLPTFHSMTFGLKEGDPLKKTVDLFTSPGRVILIGEPLQLALDYQQVRQWEHRGAYELA